MNRFVMCAAFYVYMSSAMVPGSIVHVECEKFKLVPFSKKDMADIYRKVVVKKGNNWIWGEIVGMYGNYYWVATSTARTKQKSTIIRYLNANVYNLKPKLIYKTSDKARKKHKSMKMRCLNNDAYHLEPKLIAKK